MGGDWGVTCSKVTPRPLLVAFSNTTWGAFLVRSRLIVLVKGKACTALYQNCIKRKSISLVVRFLTNSLPLIFNVTSENLVIAAGELIQIEPLLCLELKLRDPSEQEVFAKS